ncbi:hypothetical protein [Micromonospora pallida]|uniref:hypothetical protein n=1 Tax=Micromonospora pallida TaxID=145854 RepID=UPI001FE12278|nr:hypothetical protein [Micromonospora pallida]
MAGPRLRAVAVVGVTAFALLATTATATVASPGSASRGKATHDEQITWQDWAGSTDWSQGTAAGTVTTPTGLTLGVPAGTTTYRDPHTGIKRAWAYGTWTSPVTPIGFDASEMIASWNAATPAGTWLQVELQGRYTDGVQTPWYVMGRWASGTPTSGGPPSTSRETDAPTSGRTPSPYGTRWPDRCCARTSSG